MFEIKGAPCARCAYFGCRVHGFHDLCTRSVHAFSIILIPLYKEERMNKIPGARFWLPLHPVCAQYKSLISNTDLVRIKFCIGLPILVKKG